MRRPLGNRPPLGFSGLYHFVQQPRPILFAERKTRHWTGAQRADPEKTSPKPACKSRSTRSTLAVLARDRGAGG